MILKLKYYKFNSFKVININVTNLLSGILNNRSVFRKIFKREEGYDTFYKNIITAVVLLYFKIINKKMLKRD